MVAKPITVPDIDDAALYDLLSRADEAGLKLEFNETGFPAEAAPGQRHQEIVLSVTNSIREGRPERNPCGFRVTV
jgi:hypothetical protein